MAIDSREFALSLIRFKADYPKNQELKFLDNGHIESNKVKEQISFFRFCELASLGLSRTADAKLKRLITDSSIDVCSNLFDINLQILFQRIIHSLERNFLSDHVPINRHFSIQVITQEWLSHKQMEYFFMHFMHKKIEFEEHNIELLAILPPELIEFIKDPEESVECRAIKSIIDILSHTVFVESMLCKLQTKVEDPEALILPEKVSEWGFPKVISKKVLRAFASNSFMKSLVTKYPVFEEELNQIYQFGKVFNNYLMFLKSSSRYMKFCENFSKLYLQYQKQISALLKMDPKDESCQISPSLLKKLQYYGSILAQQVEEEEAFDLSIEASEEVKTIIKTYHKDYASIVLSQIQQVHLIYKAARRALFDQREDLGVHWVSYANGLKVTGSHRLELEPVREAFSDHFSFRSLIGSFESLISSFDEFSLKIEKSISIVEPENLGKVKGVLDLAITRLMTPEEITFEAEGLNLLVEEADLPFENYLRTLKEEARVFDYHDRVLLWLENKEEALRDEKYSELAPGLKDFIWKIHAFSPLVDAFIDTRFCRKMEWLNPKSGVNEPLYRILGSIKNTAGEEILGTFDFCFNEDESYCYHRCFKKRAVGERLSLLLGSPKVDYDFDYPALNKDLAKKNDEIVKLDGLSIRLLADGSISFLDDITNLIIRLIPID